MIVGLASLHGAAAEVRGRGRGHGGAGADKSYYFPTPVTTSKVRFPPGIAPLPRCPLQVVYFSGLFIESMFLHNAQSFPRPALLTPFFAIPPIPPCSGYCRTPSGALLRFGAAACACCSGRVGSYGGRQGRLRAKYPPPRSPAGSPVPVFTVLASLGTPDAYSAGWMCPFR